MDVIEGAEEGLVEEFNPHEATWVSDWAISVNITITEWPH
jgi:hypothetical protein